MEKICFSDIRNIYEYEKTREESVRKIIGIKKVRRVEITENISLVFENRETVIHQIQEMMRVERIVNDDAVQKEIDVYNSLIPGDNELSATLFIELQDYNRIKEDLKKFIGLDSGDRLWMEFGGERIFAVFEEGRSEEGRISAVHYVKFRFSEEQTRKFLMSGEAVLSVEHPAAKTAVALSKETLDSLKSDLGCDKEKPRLTV